MAGIFERVGLTQAIPDRPKKITVVNTERKVDEAIRTLLRYDFLGFDTETYHSRSKHIDAFNPSDGARMRLSQWATPDGEAFVFDHYKISSEYLLRMFPNHSYLLVGQNLIFECTFLMWELGIYEYGDIWDTMIAAQLLAKGDVVPGPFYTKVGLESIAKRELGVSLPKDEQVSHWYVNELSTSQIEYAARDALIPLPIYQRQRDKLVEQSQVKVAEIEFGIVPPCAWMKNEGIGLDGAMWEEQFHAVERQIKGVKERLWELLGIQGTLFGETQTMNLNSRPQVMQAFQRNGIDLPLDKTGKLTLSGKLLKPIEHFEAVKLYMEYVKLDKKLSSFGMSWVEAINPITGRLHGSLKLIGAETGRMAGVKPNLMQVPKEDEYRNCFRARDGWVYVDTDYSQCELRILAEQCRDPRLLEAYDNDYDLHRFSASLIYKTTMELVTKIQRGVAKNLNFGIVYKIGAAKFATDSGLLIDEGQTIMDYYLIEAYPIMNGFLLGLERSILYDLVGRTMSGRIRRYRGDLNDREVKSSIQRRARNLPIQGTNADITKRAMRLLYNRVIPNRNKFKMILPVHDELLSESRPDFALEGQDHQEQAMLQAEREFLKRVPCKVDTTITRAWCKEPSKEQLKEAEVMING